MKFRWLHWHSFLKCSYEFFHFYIIIVTLFWVISFHYNFKMNTFHYSTPSSSSSLMIYEIGFFIWVLCCATVTLRCSRPLITKFCWLTCLWLPFNSLINLPKILLKGKDRFSGSISSKISHRDNRRCYYCGWKRHTYICQFSAIVWTPFISPNYIHLVLFYWYISTSGLSLFFFSLFF